MRKMLSLIFVTFSTYLVGDIFYRWDGFKYYASFSEFLPSVALIFILWSFLALCLSIGIWLILKIFNSFGRHVGMKLKWEQMVLFCGINLFVGMILWAIKRSLLPHVHTTILIRWGLLLCMSLAATFFTWLVRDKAEKWIGTVSEHIIPLLWVFGAWLIISIPIVGYHIIPKSNPTPQNKFRNHIELHQNNKRPNIILITFDALATQDMSVYGYKLPTTPFITQWSKNASLFTRVKSASNFTTPAVASLMTGKRVWTHQSYHISGSKPLKHDIENLPSVLKDNGYYTIAFIVNPVASVSILGMSKSFDIAPPATEFSKPLSLFRKEDTVEFGVIDAFLYQVFGDKIRLYDWVVQKNFAFGWLVNALSPHKNSRTTVPPEITFNKFLSLINKNNHIEPFFAWIHLLPPHTPYLPPPQYMGSFNSIVKADNRYKIEWNIERIRYNEFIRYCDDQFQTFINQLNKMDKLKDTIIILSSDHGESFEHNYIGHGDSHLYEAVTNIPLIIKKPDQNTGHVITDLVEQIDIPATILDLAGIEVPVWMEGQSLIPLIRGDAIPEKKAFSMTFQNNPSRGHRITKGSIALWKGNYKLLYYLEKNKALLFDLKKDPSELNNLFNKSPYIGIGQELLSVIKENLKRANDRIVRNQF